MLASSGLSEDRIKKYKPKKNAAPARKNAKKKKLEREREKDIKDMMNDY